MADLGDLTLRLRAETQDFRAQLAGASGTVQEFSQQAQTSSERVQNVGNSLTFGQGPVRRFEFALASLTTQITGLNPQLERLVSGATLFAAGTEFFLPIVGTIAAVAGAYYLFTHNAAEAAQAQIKVSQEFNKAMDAVPATTANVTKYAAALKDLQGQLDAITAAQKSGIAAMLGTPGGFTDPETLRRLHDRAAVLTEELIRMRGELSKTFTGDQLTQFGGELAKAEAQLAAVRRGVTDETKIRDIGTEALRHYNEQQNFVNDAQRTEIETSARRLANIQAETAAIREETLVLAANPLLNAPDRLGPMSKIGGLQMPKVPTVTQIIPQDQLDEINREAAALNAQMDKEAARRLAGGVDTITDDFSAKLDKKLAAIGLSAGRQLIMGLIEGTMSLQQFLEKTLIDLLATTIMAGFGKLFSSGPGELFSGGGGGGGFLGDFAPSPSATVGTGSLHFSVNMPPASNPLAAARDQQWQVFLRQSILGARQDGFK